MHACTCSLEWFIEAQKCRVYVSGPFRGLVIQIWLWMMKICTLCAFSVDIADHKQTPAQDRMTLISHDLRALSSNCTMVHYK